MNSRAIPLCALCLLCAFVVNSSAAPPTLTSLYPAGVQRGTTTEISAAGAGDKSKIWTNDKGLIVEPGKEKGKFAVKVAADAVPGTYWLRAYNDEGASGLRPFIVGTLPEIIEKEPNDDPKTAQVLESSSVVVNGKLAKAGDVDCFAVTAKKGQTLVASLEANHTLKSPMDALMQIVSTDGFVLEQNHDFHGLDPQIAYAVPKDGTYIVRVFAFPSAPDTTIRFAGGETYIYRLSVTTGGFVDYTMPLAIERKPRLVELKGWNLEHSPRYYLVEKPPQESEAVLTDPKVANPFRIRIEPHISDIRTVHNPDEWRPSPPLVPPFSVSGQLKKKDELIAVNATLKKGQTLSITAESRSFGLAVDPVIRILDKDQKQLVRAEPPKLSSDTALSFTPPADGEYTIAVSDLYGGGGPRHAFLLRVTLPEPDYDLAVAADRFAIPTGKTLDIPVKITRKNGFAKAIDIIAEGLPAGVKFEVKPPGAKPDPNTIIISLSADKAGIVGGFRLVGKVKDEPKLTRITLAPLPEFEESTADLWLTVGDNPATPVPKKKK